MKTEYFNVAVEGGLARIDLGRPDAGNALTLPMVVELAALIRRHGADAGVSALALMPAGPDFCVGRDTKGEAESRQGMNAWDTRERVMGPILDLYQAMSDAPVPVVACVQGAANGLGCALAAACDITLASSAARFSLPEINGGIPPALAMSALIHRMPAKALAYAVYSAQAFSAEEARAQGIVSAVFEAQAFEERCNEFLAGLAARPRLVVTTIKRFQTNSAQLSPQMASEYAGTLLALVRSRN